MSVIKDLYYILGLYGLSIHIHIIKNTLYTFLRMALSDGSHCIVIKCASTPWAESRDVRRLHDVTETGIEKLRDGRVNRVRGRMVKVKVGVRAAGDGRCCRRRRRYGHDVKAVLLQTTALRPC